MERRKMLNLMGWGGLISLPASAGASSRNLSRKKDVRFLPTFLQLRNDKKIQAGDLISTLGFYKVNDGGGGQYLVDKPQQDSTQMNHQSGVFQLDNGLAARLINVKTVNYQLFGAVGDGKSEDGQAILAAHEFANENDLPVHNLSGDYRIAGMREIPVETNVQWGHSTFYIDEKQSTNKPVFHVRSRYKPIDIPAEGQVGQSVIRELKPGVQVIPELKDYKNHLIHFHDDKDRIAFRAGASYSKTGRPREELIYVSQEGRILGDVAWSFKSSATITAYPAENSYLLIEGGTFYLSGDSPIDPPSSYTHNGILVTRSRTRINNQWMGIEPGRSDDSMIAQSGFYYFNKVYDVQLNDIRLIPREKNRPGEDRDVPHGTYGIGGNGVLEFSMTGVVAEGADIHWGVIGTNMLKNVSLRNCRINRFDVHFHLWNLTIRDSEIGHKGITVTGGGRLHMENTTCYQNRFINFRGDYGAKWEGDIYLANCNLRPPSKNETTLLYFVASDFEYGYPIGMARSITVKDMVVDYESYPDNDATCWLIKTSAFSVTSTGERLFFPSHVRFQHIRVSGRQRGVRVVHVKNPSGYFVEQPGQYDGDLLRANSEWILDHVDLEFPDAGKDLSQQQNLILENLQSTTQLSDDHSPHFNITVRDCRHFSANITGVAVNLRIEDSTVHQLNLNDGIPCKGLVFFERCDFVPLNGAIGNEPSYALDTTLGTTFTNCVIHLPLNREDLEVRVLKFISFIEINKSVKYNHLNTRLSTGLMRYLQERNIELNDQFQRELLLHASL